MRMKRLAIVTLLGVNALLAGAIFFSRPRLPEAFAQAGLRPGAYLAVTAKPEGQSFDVVWVLDLANDKLLAFYLAQANSRQLVCAEPRNLVADFGRKAP